MARISPEERYLTYLERRKYSTGASTLTSETSRTYLRSFWSHTDPNFPRSRKWNPYHVYLQSGSRNTAVNLYEYWAGRPDMGWGDYQLGFKGCAVDLPGLDEVYHDLDVLTRCNNAHMDEIMDRKVNLLQAFAERKQVVRLILDNAKKLASAIRHVKKGNLRYAARALGVSPLQKSTRGNDIAANWLALQYGWKPLLSDIKGAAELLAQRHYSNPHRFVFLTKRRSVSKVLNHGSFFGSYPSPATLTGITTSRVRQESVYEVSNQFIRDGSSTGIYDVPTLLWELTPYSFVVDWFLPVGNFLSRLNYDAGLSFVSRLQTQYSSFEGTAAPAASHATPGMGTFLIREASGSFRSSAMRIDRMLGVAVSPKIPMFKDPFSPLHAMNAIALAMVNFDGNSEKVVKRKN